MGRIAYELPFRVAGGNFGRQPECDIARVADIDWRPLFAELVEALECDGFRNFAKMGVAPGPLVILAGSRVGAFGLGPLREFFRLLNLEISGAAGLVASPGSIWIGTRFRRDP